MHYGRNLSSFLCCFLLLCSFSFFLAAIFLLFISLVYFFSCRLIYTLCSLFEVVLYKFAITITVICIEWLYSSVYLLSLLVRNHDLKTSTRKRHLKAKSSAPAYSRVLPLPSAISLFSCLWFILWLVLIKNIKQLISKSNLCLIDLLISYLSCKAWEPLPHVHDWELARFWGGWIQKLVQYLASEQAREQKNEEHDGSANFPDIWIIGISQLRQWDWLINWLIFVYYTVNKPQQLQVTMIYIRYTKTSQ